VVASVGSALDSQVALDCWCYWEVNQHLVVAVAAEVGHKGLEVRMDWGH
jgi:hypothetical protein